jgi:predicted Zn-dependent protease
MILAHLQRLIQRILPLLTEGSRFPNKSNNFFVEKNKQIDFYLHYAGVYSYICRGLLKKITIYSLLFQKTLLL